MSLFDPTELPAPVPVEILSAGQRVTVRNRELLARGIHPATRLPLFIGTGEECSDCDHVIHVRHHRRAYWKCERHRLGPSRSEASDIRASWPACAAFLHEGEW